MEALLELLEALLDCAFILIGFKLGQAARDVEHPAPAEPVEEPVEDVHESPAPTEAEMEKRRIEAIIKNIDRYDGTEEGQVDVPWR